MIDDAVDNYHATMVGIRICFSTSVQMFGPNSLFPDDVGRACDVDFGCNRFIWAAQVAPFQNNTEDEQDSPNQSEVTAM